MIRTRPIEAAGFVLIAAALHVSAAAIVMPDAVRQGLAADAPAAATLLAGSPGIAALVEEWQTEAEVDLAPAEPPQQMAPPQDAPPDLPVTHAAGMEPASAGPRPEAASPLVPPAAATARPNLPPPPQQPRIDLTDLPELRSFDPPQIPLRQSLALAASVRPEQRPQRPEAPQPQARRAEPLPQQQQPRQQQAAPSGQAGQGGQAATRSAAQGGAGGVSASQRASLQARWQQQISACLMRSIAQTSGGSGLHATLGIRVARNGRVQSAQVTGSSGNARVDREIARGAQRARCPAAPPALTEASYAFSQPISIR